MSKMIFIIGVSGCGKTTIAKQLSKKINIPFLEGDSFHPKENINKMSTGEALTDQDRLPWLKKINNGIRSHSEKGCIIACSALKLAYRKVLSKSLDQKKVIWFYLKGNKNLISNRLKLRKNHFMPYSLLASQFDVLEETKELISVSIDQTEEEVLDAIIKKLNDVKS